MTTTRTVEYVLLPGSPAADQSAARDAFYVDINTDAIATYPNTRKWILEVTFAHEVEVAGLVARATRAARRYAQGDAITWRRETAEDPRGFQGKMDGENYC